MKLVVVLTFITEIQVWHFSFFHKIMEFSRIKASKWTRAKLLIKRLKKSHARSRLAATRMLFHLQKNGKRHQSYFHFGSHAFKFHQFLSKRRLQICFREFSLLTFENNPKIIMLNILTTSACNNAFHLHQFNYHVLFIWLFFHLCVSFSESLFIFVSSKYNVYKQH